MTYIYIRSTRSDFRPCLDGTKGKSEKKVVLSLSAHSEQLESYRKHTSALVLPERYFFALDAGPNTCEDLNEQHKDRD